MKDKILRWLWLDEAGLRTKSKMSGWVCVIIGAVGLTVSIVAFIEARYMTTGIQASCEKIISALDHDPDIPKSNSNIVALRTILSVLAGFLIHLPFYVLLFLGSICAMAIFFGILLLRISQIMNKAQPAAGQDSPAPKS